MPPFSCGFVGNDTKPTKYYHRPIFNSPPGDSSSTCATASSPPRGVRIPLALADPLHIAGELQGVLKLRVRDESAAISDSCANQLETLSRGYSHNYSSTNVRVGKSKSE